MKAQASAPSRTAAQTQLGSVPAAAYDALNEPGAQLEPDTRTSMESHFGEDFSGVRVHTGARAADSARTLGAYAYTVGDDIVFGAGRYTPARPDGRWLLAHELTHVVQQRQYGPPRLQPATAGMPRTHEEWEATRRAGETMRSGAGAGAGADASADPRGRPLRSSAAGGVVGGILGGLGGAGLGIALGALAGPIGMIVGGILGGILGAVGGAIAGDVLTADTRELTPGEKDAARLAFGSSLDLAPIRITETPVMAVGGAARTPFNTVYFPPGSTQLPVNEYMPWLIHELGHCWQTQHGISVAEKLFYAVQGSGVYNYGGEEGLRTATAAGRTFLSFNTEQQADIVADYYRKRYIENADYSAYLPFIVEFNPMAAIGAPAPEEEEEEERELNDRNLLAPEETTRLA